MPEIPPSRAPQPTLGSLLREVAHGLRKRFDRKAASLGLTRAQWSVLYHLNRCEGVNQRTLATLLDIEPITLTRTLDRMQRSGWIERRPDSRDRRAHCLHLTARARPMITRLLKLAAENRAEALEGVRKEDRAQLMRILFAMRENLHRLFAAESDGRTNNLARR